MLTPWTPPHSTFAYWVLIVQDITAEVELAENRQQQAQERLRATVEAQEAERSRLANELHDGIGPQLASLKLLISRLGEQLTALEASDTAERQPPPPTAKPKNPELYNRLSAMVEEAKQLADTAMDDIRKSARNLSPADLERNGLGPGIGELLPSTRPAFFRPCGV